jgi:hypothetical protein
MSLSTPLRIASPEDIVRARTAIDHDAVVVDARRLKASGLLPLALKYALFAVREGGRIMVEDEPDSELGSPAYAVPHKLVRQWTFQFLGRDVELISLEPPGRIELRRTRPITPPGWSAGIVFSGRDAEIPVLLKALDGLHAQPELSEIAVCGPPRDLSFLEGFARVRYVEHVDPPGERVMIAAKKNALIRALNGPRVLILHARVVLAPGALAAVPREFDISGPNVLQEGDGRRASYLSLSSTETIWPGRMPRRTPWLMRHVGDDAIALHRIGQLFVDGGAFYVTRAAHALCPLNDLIAWNEAEDVEWCARAFVQGLLVDIAPDSIAVSQTAKVRMPPNLGAFTAPLLRLLKQVREIKAAARRR